MLYANTINANQPTSSCQQRLLFPQQTLPTNAKELDAVADKSSKTGDDTYILSGNAALKSSQFYLAADKIHIERINKSSVATGNVQFQSNDFMLTGSKATIDQKNETPYAILEQVHFQYPESQISGQAEKVVNNGKQQIFDVVNYSLCPIGNIDWQIKADKITLDTESNLGKAEEVTLEFLGVPIFYIPQYQWTLKGRGSGFLAPSIATYKDSSADEKNGYQIKIPYYFNLAPDRDFLLTLNRLSTRGSIIEGIYRQLLSKTDNTQIGRFEIEGHYLNEDIISKNKRWLLNSKLNLSINKKIRINMDTNRVSDADYFQDIRHNNTSISSLNSQFDINYFDEDNQLQLSLLTESEQLVNDGTATYTRAPEVSISKRIQGLGGRTLDLSIISTKFTHKNNSKPTGKRTHIQADFKRTIKTDAYAFAPQLNLSRTQYNLDNATNQQRTLAKFRLDSKLFLERDSSFFGNSLIQTLTPILTYNYASKKDQSALPEFDSEEKNFSYEALFSTQNYTGLDRINAANNFTFGLESDFIDKQNGDTYLNLKIAQAFYLDGQDIDTDGNLVNRRKYSDIAIVADFALDNISFNNAFRYNPEDNEITKRDSAISYTLGDKKFLTLAHHDDENDNEIESVELYGAYPINKKIHIFAGVNRSLTDEITNKETSGIAYESCCWAVRLAHFKTHLSSGDYEYVTNFELVLKGFASSSSNTSKRLAENIPNYLSYLEN